MATKLNIVDIKKNGGGVNTYDAPDNIAVEEIAPRSRNIRVQGNSFMPRKGYISYADTLTGGDGVGHVTYYSRITASNNRLAMFYNNNIYFADPSSASPSWSEVTAATYTTSDNTNTVNYRDWLLVFNGVDKPHRLEGTTASQPFTAPDSLTANTFLPRFGVEYNGVLFVAGVPSAPNIVYSSKASTAGNPEYIYDFSGAASGLGDADSYAFDSEVTGMRELSGALIVFTKTKAYYIEGLKEIASAVIYEPKPISGAQGAVRHEATCVVENDVYYLTPQGEIRSVRRGFSDSLSMLTNPMSLKIQPFLDETIDRTQDTAFMVYNSAEKEFHLYVKEDGGFFNSLRIVGDTANIDPQSSPRWFFDNNVPFSCGTVYEGSFYAGAFNQGKIYKLNSGYADDDTGSIATLRSSKDFNTNDPMAYKVFRNVREFLELTESTSVTFEVYVDDVLARSYTVRGSSVYGAGNNYGGIGTQSIGSFEIGSEGQAAEQDILGALLDTYVNIKMRKRGRRVRIDVKTNGVNQYYRMRQQQYWFSNVGVLFNQRAQ